MRMPSLYDEDSAKTWNDTRKAVRKKLLGELPSANLHLQLLLRVCRLQNEEILKLRGVEKNADGHYNPQIAQSTELSFFNAAWDLTPDTERASMHKVDDKPDADGNKQKTIFDEDAKAGKPKGKGRGKNKDDGSSPEGGPVTTKRLGEGECPNEQNELPPDLPDDQAEQMQTSDEKQVSESSEMQTTTSPETQTVDATSADQANAASTTAASDAGIAALADQQETSTKKPSNLKVVQK
jgi:hypothetical protein